MDPRPRSTRTRAGLTLGGLLSRPARYRLHVADGTPETARHLVGASRHIRRRAGWSSEHPRSLTVAREAVVGRLRPSFVRFCPRRIGVLGVALVMQWYSSRKEAALPPQA